jgi:5-methylcytosine-specific restriction endonuclease McrA
MKICSKCKVDKDINEFHKNKSKKDGRATECKLCKRQQDIKYKKEHANYYKAYLKEYNQINKQELYEQKKKYIADNKLDHLKRRHIWYEINKDEVKARVSQYKKDHPEQYQMYANKRLAQKKTSVIENFATQDIKNKYGDKCFYCGGLFSHIDHYIPLSKAGPHTLENIRPSCEHCNLTKSNKLPEEFIRYKGNTNE